MIMLIKVFVLLLVVYILHNSYKKYKKLDKNELKGPTPIPVLGNLHQLSSLPHRDLSKMTKDYGDIFRIWFADLYTVVISDPVLIRKIYVENHESFRDRPKIPSMKYGTYYHGTAASMGEDWVRNRGIVSSAMRKSNIKHIYEVINNQVDVLMSTMKKYEKRSEPFEPRYYMTKYTMAAMFKYIFNEDIGEDEDIHTGEIQKIMGPMNQVMEDFGTGSLFDVLEISQSFYLKWLELTEKNFPLLLKFFNVRYQQHLETIKPESPRDLLDILINEYGTNTHDDYLNIASTVLDFFFAGTDTSSTTLEYLFLMMANYPEIQDKVHQEVKSYLKQIGKDKVELNDRQSLPYVVAVIKETLRFKPVTPFGVPRSCVNEITIDDKYFIPKGAQVIINYPSIFENEKYFKNSNQFDPSRFLQTTTATNTATNEESSFNSNLAFIPFSIGPRNCVGMQFAQDELFLAFANIVLNFTIKSVDGKKIDESISYGVTLKPKTRFKVLLEKRLI
ncbi:hypothetical protein ACTFIW_009117 [Dictyostelium discoideum]